MVFDTQYVPQTMVDTSTDNTKQINGQKTKKNKKEEMRKFN